MSESDRDSDAGVSNWLERIWNAFCRLFVDENSGQRAMPGIEVEIGPVCDQHGCLTYRNDGAVFVD